MVSAARRTPRDETIYFILLLLLLSLVVEFGCRSDIRNNAASEIEINSINTTEVNLNVVGTQNEQPIETKAYIGCWNGMHGGRLRVTSTVIYDRGSKESSRYKELSVVKKQPSGLQTGEAYLLETSNDFPKSFLARFISFSFNSDGTVGIGAYDSYDSYLNDDYVGAGLFEKTPCD